MRFNSLAKYFPLPEFLNPHRVGISFSDSSIKAISFEGTPSHPRFKSMIVPIDNKSIANGSISNIDEVISKLSVIKKSFDTRFVSFTVPDEISYVFSASVPLSSGGDLTEGVAFIMEENVPLSLSDTVFDFTPIGVSGSDSKFEASVVVAACVKKEVEKFVEAFLRSGFEPVGCLHESQAIAKAIVPADLSLPVCIVHTRKNRIGIHLVKGGLVHFSTIRSVLDDNYEKQFLDEYEKFSEYYLKYDPDQSRPIKSVLICGEFEYAQKASGALSEYSGGTKEVLLSNVWTNIFKMGKHLPDLPYEKSLSFAGSIGAAMADITQ